MVRWDNETACGLASAGPRSFLWAVTRRHSGWCIACEHDRRDGVTPDEGDVNRAGRLVAELLAAYKADDFETLERLEGDELERLEAAVETIEWWRRLHAKPLTSLSANLRHYLKEQGPVVVTQRLKRAPTMIDKLLREPTMNLTVASHEPGDLMLRA